MVRVVSKEGEDVDGFFVGAGIRLVGW